MPALPPKDESDDEDFVPFVDEHGLPFVDDDQNHIGVNSLPKQESN
jgi:hypothetical protein